MASRDHSKNLVIAAFFAVLAPTLPVHAGDLHLIFQKDARQPSATVVSPLASFSRALGYGYEPQGAVVDASAQCVQPASPTADPIKEADTTTRFSVSLPEGSYRVTLNFRKAPKGAVTAEARRFYFLASAPGQKVSKSISFLIDLHTSALPPLPLNAPGGTKVRLNPRECGSYSWDDKLTLGFTRDAADLLSLDIVPAEAPRLFLMGDSTVTDQPQPPYAGWGQMLPLFFNDKLVVASYAESGETLKSFLAELRLDKVLSQAKPGDWALLQFSHNDEKSQWPQTHEPAESTFPLYLKLYIAELRRKGVSPILVTPMQRLRFDADGKIVETHGAYPVAIRAIAAAEGVPLIDLTEQSRILFEKLGPEKARNAFAGHGADATHQSSYGAFELARIVAETIRVENSGLAQFLKPGVSSFNTAEPDKLDSVSP
jgi:lysophospholipase L1-like esterase